MRRVLCLFVATIVGSQSVATSQDLLPKVGGGVASPVFSLGNLLQIKLDVSEKEPKLICMVNAYREEERDGTFTRYRQEQRTRIVTVVVDGEEQQSEQAYTVRVPYTQTGNQKVLVPAGKKPVIILWKSATVYKLDATPLTLEEARKELAKLKTVFLVESTRRGVEPAPKAVLDVVKPGTLILSTQALRGKL